MDDMKKAKRRQRKSNQDLMLNSTGTAMRHTQNSVIFSKHGDEEGMHAYPGNFQSI